MKDRERKNQESLPDFCLPSQILQNKTWEGEARTLKIHPVK